MNTFARPYRVGPEHIDDSIRQNFADNFWTELNDKLNKDKDFCRLKFLTSKYKTNSSQCFINVLRSSLVFQYSKGRNKGQYQTTFKIDIKKLRDGLINGLDNNVISELRRNPNQPEKQLLMFSEIIHSTHDIGFVYNYEPAFNRISFIRPLERRRGADNLILAKLCRKILSLFTDDTEPFKEGDSFETKIKR